MERLCAAVSAYREDGESEGARENTLYGILLPRQPATVQTGGRIYTGMGSMEDVEANLGYAAKAKPNMLTPAEREALGAAIYAYRHAPGHIDCTGCYQCIPCPQNVAIGYIFAYVYNNYLLHRNKERAMMDYTVSMSPVQRGDPASSCIGCGECLAKCPQHLDIPNLLAKVKETMGK